VLSSCHFGNIIEYDTVTNLSWSVDVRTHAIAQMVDKVLSEPWAAANELGLEVPPLKRQDDCVVSFRVPSHKVEFLSHWRGVAAGLLQMGLWKLQPMMISKLSFEFEMPIYACSKNITTSYDRTINCFREDVRDGQATRRTMGCTGNPWDCSCFVSKSSRGLRAECCPLDILTESRHEFDQFQIRVSCYAFNMMTLFSVTISFIQRARQKHPRTVERQ
jgi:hypothetical protein